VPYTLTDVTAAAERLWPASGASDWDAVGLVVGDPSDTVTSVRFAVDAVRDTIDEAVEAGDDLLLVHHPLLLRGVTSVAADGYKGSVVTRALRGGCAVLAAHTNADVVESGTSGALAAALGLTDIRPIEQGESPTRGIGRVGTLPDGMTLGRLARSLAELLPATAGGVRVAGDYERSVTTVALCAGAGDSLLQHPAVRGADVYITSDLRHHPASEAKEEARVAGGPALIDTSHWASEWLWLENAAAELAGELPDLRITVSDLRTDPWDFAIV